MSVFSRLRSWIRAVTHRSALEQDMDAELRAHLEFYAEDLVRSGIPPQEAARRARAELGSMAARKEDMREALGLRLLDEARGDLRYAWRQLRRSPGFAAVAVLSLALGIGANAVIFTILNGLAFRGLSIADADQMLSVSQTLDGRAVHRRVRFEPTWLSYTEYERYREDNHVFSGLLAYAPYVTATLGGDEPRVLTGALTSCNYFDVLGVRPALGRGFLESDCVRPGAGAVVVLSHEVWRAAFAGDPSLVGRTVMLNRVPLVVVGIAGPGFMPTGPVASAFWAPVTIQPTLMPKENLLSDDNLGWLAILGRPRAGIGLAEIRADLAVIAARLDAPQPERKTRVAVRRATMFDMPQAHTALVGIGTVLLSVVALVLLVACVNVANMLTARAAARRREVAVRLALGAGRGRLVRQLLTESALLAGIGGMFGSLLAFWSSAVVIRKLLSYVPAQVPPLALSLAPDGRVLAYGCLVTALTALACGLAPALRASRPNLTTELKQECGEPPGPSRGARFWRHGLLGAQVMVSMVLLLVAGLLMRAWYRTETIDPGFRTANISVASYDLSGAGYDEPTALSFQRRLTERLSMLPGVTTALTWAAPLSATLGDRYTTADGTAHFGEWNNVSPGYFSLLEIPIVRGRSFTEADGRDNAPVAIVTESTARRFWPGVDPIGQTIRRGGSESRGGLAEVIGIAKDAQVSRLAESDTTRVYFPDGAAEQSKLSLLVRSAGGSTSIAREIRAAVRALDPQLVVDVNALDDSLQAWRDLSRLAASASVTLGALALTLAAIGIYGVVAYSVSRRTREIGIRMALGATRSEVQALLLRQTLRPVVVGALAGIACTAGVSRVLSSALYGVSPYDAVSFVGVPLFLLAIAAAASYLPARRATRVDPLIALKYE